MVSRNPLGLTRARAFTAAQLVAVAMAATSCAIADLFGKKDHSGPSVIWHVAGKGVSTPAYDGEMK